MNRLQKLHQDLQATTKAKEVTNVHLANITGFSRPSISEAIRSGKINNRMNRVLDLVDLVTEAYHITSLWELAEPNQGAAQIDMRAWVSKKVDKQLSACRVLEENQLDLVDVYDRPKTPDWLPIGAKDSCHRLSDEELKQVIEIESISRTAAIGAYKHFVELIINRDKIGLRSYLAILSEGLYQQSNVFSALECKGWKGVDGKKAFQSWQDSKARATKLAEIVLEELEALEISVPKNELFGEECETVKEFHRALDALCKGINDCFSDEEKRTRKHLIVVIHSCSELDKFKKSIKNSSEIDAHKEEEQPKPYYGFTSPLAINMIESDIKNGHIYEDFDALMNQLKTMFGEQGHYEFKEVRAALVALECPEMVEKTPDSVSYRELNLTRLKELCELHLEGSVREVQRPIVAEKLIEACYQLNVIGLDDSDEILKPLEKLLAEHVNPGALMNIRLARRAIADSEAMKEWLPEEAA